MEKNKMLDRNKTPEKSRLGRGLSSLIPPMAKAAVDVPHPALPTHEPPDLPSYVQQIPIASIVANTLQPRTEFDTSALQELADSIAVHGVLQPVMVRPRGGGRYELVAGERRFRAAQIAGLMQIPVVVREMTDSESLTVALIENIQREDLNAMEAARGYKELLEQFGLTQAELAHQIGKSQSTIAYALSLLRLSSEMQDSISSGSISMEHGKVLLSVSDSEQRVSLWQAMLHQGLSVVEARKQALAETASPRLAKSTRSTSTEEPGEDIHLQAIEDRLRSVLGLKVSIRTNRTGRGIVTIDYANMDELETIIDRIVNE